MSHVLQQLGVRWDGDRPARDEIAALLRDDHQQVLLALGQFERMGRGASAAGREAQVRRICALLSLHATLEEDVLYPALRSCPELGDRERRLIHEAEVEQLVVRILMSQLRRMEAQDPQFEPLVGVLGRYVEHHVQDVEQGLLPRLGVLTSMDWQRLAQGLHRRREELLVQWQQELRGEGAP